MRFKSVMVLYLTELIGDVLFPTHAGVAYLLYRLITFLQDTPPTSQATVGVLLGALLPDLVDKPLAFGLGIHASRNVLHSIFFALLLICASYFIVSRRNPTIPVMGFVTGYLSHLGADIVDSWFIPSESLTFLLWPILGYHHMGPSSLLTLLDASPYTLLQTILLLSAVLLWVHDGKPGSDFLRR